MTIYLDAVLEPPRSLSPSGFDRLMLVLGVFALVSSLVFTAMGAWPVAGFMGLDVLLVWFVFRQCFRAQEARTYVRVTAETIDVRRVDAKGRERRATLPAHFARIEEDGAALSIAHAHKRYAIGDHLTPAERQSFARRLREALNEARRERHTGEI